MQLDLIMIIWYFDWMARGRIIRALCLRMLMSAFETNACIYWFFTPKSILLKLSWFRAGGGVGWGVGALFLVQIKWPGHKLGRAFAPPIMLTPSMSHFTDVAKATRHKQRQRGAGGEKPGGGESETQINALLVLQCIRTRITAVTAAPVSPLTEKNYKYYHLHH